MATKSEDVGLIVRAIKLVSKIFNLCGHDLPTSETDEQTDRRQVIARPRFAL